MTAINSELFDALVSAGAAKAIAKAAAESVQPSSELATRCDLKAMEASLLKWVAELLLAQTGALLALIKWVTT